MLILLCDGPGLAPASCCASCLLMCFRNATEGPRRLLVGLWGILWIRGKWEVWFRSKRKTWATLTRGKHTGARRFLRVWETWGDGDECKRGVKSDVRWKREVRSDVRCKGEVRRDISWKFATHSMFTQFVVDTRKRKTTKTSTMPNVHGPLTAQKTLQLYSLYEVYFPMKCPQWFSLLFPFYKTC